MELSSIKPILVFTSWAVFTFSSHYCAKIFLSQKENVHINAFYLTLLQMFCGSFSIFYNVKEVLLNFIPLVRRVKKKCVTLIQLKKIDKKMALIGCCHALGVFMTNCSLGVTTASLTHMVKMSESIMTAILMTVMGKIGWVFTFIYNAECICFHFISAST